MPTITKTDEPASLTGYKAKTLLLIGSCFMFSGATGLIYEVLWARMLGLVFGATTLAISTVLAAFMAGLALGSALAGRIASGIRRPLRAYGIIEIGIALYALSVPLLFSLVDNFYALIWQQFHPSFFAFSLWRFALSCVMLLVPTTLMGATLPVLSSALVRSPGFKSTWVTRLYTCNLVGAIGGTIVAGFFLLPTLGMRATIYFAAAINIVIGLAALFVDRASEAADSNSFLDESIKSLLPKWETREVSTVKEIEDVRFWLFCAFVSGFITISVQVAWTRVLTMIIGSSTYAFTIVVALFLTGLSAGAFVIGRKRRTDRLRSTILKVELLTAISLYLSLAVVSKMPGFLLDSGLHFEIGTWGGLLILQILAAGLLILLPAFLMGTVMPLVLVWASSGRALSSVRLVGRSYAINTLGAISGAFFTGFILIPNTSTKYTILFAGALCVLVAGIAYQPRSDVRDRDLRRSLAVGATALLILLLFVLAPGMNLENLSVGAYDTLVRVLAKTRQGVSDGENVNGPEVHKLLMYEEGPTSTVSVRKDWDITSLAINGRTNASDREDMPTQVMLGQLPLLLAPSLNNGLVVGFASGVTAGAMLQSPIESLECIELEPATIAASRYFEHVNNRPLSDPRLRLIIDDARTYLRVTPTRYDVIVSEPSHPWVPGVANLFTQEFFARVRDRLTESGLFAQWVQIYQLSTESLRSVLATYQKVFPHVLVFRVGGATKGKDLILIGSQKPLSFDLLTERLKDPRTSAELTRVGMDSEAAVRSWYVCDETELAPALAGAVINTDDNMHIETTVPREAFLPLMQTNSVWIERLAGR
jgi:spermidine synthase